MKITLYPAGKGDCFLITGAAGARLLVDGGMGNSYRDHVAPALARLKAIDVVCVSHIDQDHIQGVLEMMEDAVAWRVHDYQVRTGNRDHPAPRTPRPPQVGRIWHNAFQDQVGKNAGRIESTLAATATILQGAEDLYDVAEAHQDLATGVADALRLSRRIGSEQMNIPLNPEFGGRLVLVRDAPVELQVGTMRLLVLGPFADDLTRLRTEWIKWLERNQAAVRKIRELVPPDGTRAGIGASQVSHLAIAQAQILGDRNKVTAPNLASIMLLVEEDGRTLLATGDGHHRDILKGLEKAESLDASGNMHVSVLKVQHHGSEHNIDETFCKAITADHYIFCANGAHENPDLRVIDAIIDGRMAAAGRIRGTRRSRFTLWFNSSSKVAEHADERAHMKKIEQLVRRRLRSRPEATAVFRSTVSEGLRVLR